MLGGAEGFTVGKFDIPDTAATNDTVVVLDAGVGANSNIFLQLRGTGAQKLQAYVTAQSAGTSFTVTVAAAAAITGPVTCHYLRTD